MKHSSRLNHGLNQSGVALIQILLIVAMILILVVQLSKQSRQQVSTALALKQKMQALIDIDNVAEQVQFALLTENKAKNNASELTKIWNFYGQAFTYLNVEITLQDEAGLISLPFNLDYLTLLMGAEAGLDKTKQQAIENLKLWQGTNESVNIPAGWRGSYMQYTQELRQVPGWKNITINDNLLTYLPMYYFNPATAPEMLLSLLAKPGESDVLLKKRADNSLDLAEINAHSRFDFSDSMTVASEFIRVSISFDMEDWTLVRSFKYQVSPLSIKPILQIGR